MITFKNKIINIDYAKSNEYLYLSEKYYDGDFVFSGGNMKFDNCIFIGNEEVVYIFENNTIFNNCVFYYPKGISINCFCEVSNVSIIGRDCYKMDIDINIKDGKSTIAFYSCLFNDFNGPYLRKSQVQFIDCINAPRFYKNKKPFYGYKYSKEGYLIILEIPKNVEIYESGDYDGNKCRTDRAKVISILSTNGIHNGVKKCKSWYDHTFIYRVGDYVYNQSSSYYDPCAEGIHFCKTLKDAYKFFCTFIVI